MERAAGAMMARGRIRTGSDDRPWVLAALALSGILIALATWNPSFSWSAALALALVLTVRQAWAHPTTIVVLAIATMVAPTLYVAYVGSYGIAPYIILECVALIAWAASLGRRRLVVPVGFPFLAVYVALTTFSAALSTDTMATLSFLVRLWLSWLVVFLLLWCVSDRRQLTRVVIALLVHAALVTVVTLGPVMSMVGLPSYQSFLTPHFQKNDLGTYLTFAFMLGLAVFASKRRGAPLRALAMLVMILAGLCWPVTYSRSGLLALLSSILIVALLSRSGRTIGMLAVGATLAGLAIFALPRDARLTATYAIDSLIGRDAPDSFGETASQRLTLMNAGLETIARHPLLGVGLGEWAHESPIQLTLWDGKREEVVTVGANLHNRFMLIAAESGVFALLAYLGFVMTLILSAFRAARTADSDMRLLLNALIAATCGYLVAMLFMPGTLWEWNLLALLAVTGRIATREAAARARARATGPAWNGS